MSTPSPTPAQVPQGSLAGFTGPTTVGKNTLLQIFGQVRTPAVRFCGRAQLRASGRTYSDVLGYGHEQHAALQRAFVDRAKIAALALAGPPVYRVDAVPSATAFWRALGFEASGGSDSPTTRVMRRS